MYKNILIATDGSELAAKAMQQGLQLAKALKAQATAVAVTESWNAMEIARQVESRVENPVERYEKGAAEWAAKVLAGAQTTANSLGTPLKTVHIKDSEPAEGILEAAKSNGCDLIVMASHGRRGVAKLLLGSQAVKVLTHGKVPVLICR